jgi:hypothetical protein
VLAYGFTVNRQFVAKTDRKFVFLGRDAHILDLLYITVPHMCFYEFQKNSKFCSKSISVSLRFYCKLTVCGKTKPKSVFHGCDTHILDRLHIMVPYMCFDRFLKILIFCSKSKRVSLRFYRKSTPCGKNRPKIHISWPWCLFSRSVIRNCQIYVF